MRITKKNKINWIKLIPLFRFKKPNEIIHKITYLAFENHFSNKHYLLLNKNVFSTV